MFKVNQINGEEIESTTSVSTVLGNACHKAMETYLGGNESVIVSDESEAIKLGYQAGLDYLSMFSDGLIRYNSTTENRASLEKRYSFAFFGYVKEYNREKRVKESVLVEDRLKHRVIVDGKELPVPLVGHFDHVFDDHEGKLIIEDHKFVSRWSGEDEIDGSKLLQAAFGYLLVSAETGRTPYSMLFREFKTSENKDGSVQTKEFEIVFGDHPLIFELFFRMYQDITDALLGKQVFVPNLHALFDREVSILAYIHRLDMDEERAKALQQMKVDNITDFLKRRIAKDRSMKRFAETVSKSFVSAKTLNYKDMTNEEKIKMKLAEHGLVVNVESTVKGRAVTLYRFEPSIGLKMSKIEGYVKDIEQILATSGIRVLAPIPDSDLIGFEVPNKERTFPDTAPAPEQFKIAVGEDLTGKPYFMDLRDAPHLLVAGATGSGKSVFISHLIEQLQATSASQCELYLFDPKMVELARYAEGSNTKVYADDAKEIAKQLSGLVKEMNRRYKMMKERKARDLEEYRKAGGRLPYIFVFVDEFGDLIMQKDDAADATKTSIIQIAQKARAAGIHVVLTTQRPSVNVVDGLIKANFPTRIAFRTASATDSEIILDQRGAEKLLGKGDMLLLTPREIGLKRLQGYSA